MCHVTIQAGAGLPRGVTLVGEYEQSYAWQSFIAFMWITSVAVCDRREIEDQKADVDLISARGTVHPLLRR